MTKLIISGGRDFEDVDFALDVLLRYHAYSPVTEVITGEAKGADTLGMAWAAEMGIPHKGFPVLDTDWKKLGPKAGHVRNKQMLDYGPDAVIAFPGGNGTQNMVEIASEVPWVEVVNCERLYFRKEQPDSWFCSNFAEGFDFADDDGCYWMTSEHYYQAAKTVDPDEQFKIQSAKSPRDAKDLGGAVKFKRMDWEKVKVEAMRRAIKYKFAEGTRAAELLKLTGYTYLIEYAPWGDVFWGVNSDLLGHNWLGRLLNERKFQL